MLKVAVMGESFCCTLIKKLLGMFMFLKCMFECIFKTYCCFERVKIFIMNIQEPQVAFELNFQQKKFKERFESKKKNKNKIQII